MSDIDQLLMKYSQPQQIAQKYQEEAKEGVRDCINSVQTRAQAMKSEEREAVDEEVTKTSGANITTFSLSSQEEEFPFDSSLFAVSKVERCRLTRSQKRDNSKAYWPPATEGGENNSLQVPALFQQDQRGDPTLRDAWTPARMGDPGFRTTEGGVLLKTKGSGDRIFVLQRRRQVIFREAHSKEITGHFGRKKTSGKIATHFCWPGVTADIKAWIQSCAEYQEVFKRPSTESATHATTNHLYTIEDSNGCCWSTSPKQ